MRSPFLLAFLVDLYQERRFDWTEDNAEDDPKLLEEQVTDLCNQLISTHDTIRAKYWEYILNKFRLKLPRNEADQQSNSTSNEN